MLTMDQVCNPHYSDDEIERYSMGTLDAVTLAKLEEHLLICDPCRQRVSASDAYLAALRQAAKEVIAETEKPDRPAVAPRADN